MCNGGSGSPSHSVGFQNSRLNSNSKYSSTTSSLKLDKLELEVRACLQKFTSVSLRNHYPWGLGHPWTKTSLVHLEFNLYSIPAKLHSIYYIVLKVLKSLSWKKQWCSSGRTFVTLANDAVAECQCNWTKDAMIVQKCSSDSDDFRDINIQVSCGMCFRYSTLGVMMHSIVLPLDHDETSSGPPQHVVKTINRIPSPHNPECTSLIIMIDRSPSRYSSHSS